MSSVSTWILSILGIVVLSIVVDILLPSGKMQNFIKSFFAYVIVIVVLTPVVSFLSRRDFSFDNVFQETSIPIQENFVSNINKQLLDSVSTQIEDECKDIGIQNIQIGFQADIFESTLKIKQVSIDLSQMVIDKNFLNINVKEKIIQIIQSNIKVEKEIIVFYE